MAPDSATEALLRRDRMLVLAGLAGLGLISWIWILLGAGMQMSAWQMTAITAFPHLAGRADTMPMAMGWTLAQALVMVLMWWVMMIAMMLPSVVPIILLHARTLRYGQRKGRVAAEPLPTAWFLAGYLVVWLAFSGFATALQWGFEQSELLSAMMLSSQSRWLSACVLVLAAFYQVSPLKRMCLAHCRAPAEYLARHWRSGPMGTFRMGIGHGAFCVGCCWALMLLLFVGGVMNLVWIAALSILVLAEKLAPTDWPVSPLAAALLAIWAAATLVV